MIRNSEKSEIFPAAKTNSERATPVDYSEQQTIDVDPVHQISDANFDVVAAILDEPANPVFAAFSQEKTRWEN